MALSREVIYLGRLYHTNDLYQGHGVAHITIVKVELWVSLKMRDTLAIVNRGTTNYAMNIIALADQELTKIRAILTGDTCN